MEGILGRPPIAFARFAEDYRELLSRQDRGSGRRYYGCLGHVFGPDIYGFKFVELVPGVGLSGRGMFTSEQGKGAIFFDADRAAAAMRAG